MFYHNTYGFHFMQYIYCLCGDNSFVIRLPTDLCFMWFCFDNRYHSHVTNDFNAFNKSSITHNIDNTLQCGRCIKSLKYFFIMTRQFKTKRYKSIKFGVHSNELKNYTFFFTKYDVYSGHICVSMQFTFFRIQSFSWRNDHMET